MAISNGIAFINRGNTWKISQNNVVVMEYICYTDGAYSPINDQGGIGIVFLRDNKVIAEFSKGISHTTNNRMELTAIICAFRAIKKPIDKLTIISDSMYCIGTITLNWKRKKNQDLWALFDKEYNRALNLCKIIEWKHVKGHQKENIYNNRADCLAVRGSQAIISTIE